MTCEEFYEAYAVNSIDDCMQELYWDGGYSSQVLMDHLGALAMAENIILSDYDTWNYETFFWDVYRNTEKGLS